MLDWPILALDQALSRVAAALLDTPLAPSRLSLAVLPAYVSLDSQQYIWDAETPDTTTVLTRPPGFLDSPEHRQSPLYRVFSTGQPVRARLCDGPATAIDRYPFVAELAERGFTDYVAIPLPTRSAAMPVLSLATRQPGGWPPEAQDRIPLFAPTLSLLVEVAEAQRLVQLVGTDPLTGIANRRTFDGEFREAWDACATAQTPLSLIYFDVDHFKRFNDTWGHIAGDRCLVKIAATANAATPRGHNLVARIGGEEFAILLPGVDRASATELAERVRGASRICASTPRRTSQARTRCAPRSASAWLPASPCRGPIETRSSRAPTKRSTERRTPVATVSSRTESHAESTSAALAPVHCMKVSTT